MLCFTAAKEHFFQPIWESNNELKSRTLLKELSDIAAMKNFSGYTLDIIYIKNSRIKKQLYNIPIQMHMDLEINVS